MSVVRRNARILIQNATVYPFKLPGSVMVCVYCDEQFEEASPFRQHMDVRHNEVKRYCLPKDPIKVDCTKITCRICSNPFEKLEDVAGHLKQTHRHLSINLNVDLGLQAFKFMADDLSCVVCNEKFFSLRALSRHTQTHYVKFTCEACGKAYSTSGSLQYHVRNVHTQKRKCQHCQKEFNSALDKRKHLKESSKCWYHLCNLCGERFINWTTKQRHMIEAHKHTKSKYVCPECGEECSTRQKLGAHFKIVHTDQNFECTFCDLKFHKKKYLADHVIVHTKEKLFPCTVCSKSFSRKKNLVQHSWIHSEQKRFKCKICNKPFNQKVCLKAHMKGYHPEDDFE